MRWSHKLSDRGWVVRAPECDRRPPLAFGSGGRLVDLGVALRLAMAPAAVVQRRCAGTSDSDRRRCTRGVLNAEKTNLLG